MVIMTKLEKQAIKLLKNFGKPNWIMFPNVTKKEFYKLVKLLTKKRGK